MPNPLLPYPPLPAGKDAIRILTITPGGFTDPMKCQLVSVAFSEKPKYIALSYTWDSPYNDAMSEKAPSSRSLGEMTINGASYVDHGTSNLMIALRHLRSRTHPLKIWVDAICINQSDLEERGQQVALMAFIYTRALKVVAWLGPWFGPDVRDEGRHRGSLIVLRDNWEKGATIHLASIIAGDRKSVWSVNPGKASLERMASSTYWSRLWIVQEMCLATDLIIAYGPSAWPWDAVRTWISSAASTAAVLNAKSVLPVEDIYTTMMNRFEARQQRFTEGMRLERLIERFADSRCSEPRDRVYGLLGLASDALVGAYTPADLETDEEISDGSFEFRVDYTRSFYSIWQDTLQHILSQGIKASPKYHVGFNRQVYETERHMSFVRAAGIVHTALGGHVEKEARAQSLLKMRTAPLELQVIGFISSTILHIGPDHTSLISTSSVMKRWEASWSQAKSYSLQPDILREKNRAYMGKLIDSTPEDLQRVEDYSDPRVSAWLWRKSDTKPKDNRPSVKKKPSKDQKSPEPRIFLGTNSNIGLVPPSAEVGDVIIRFATCGAALVMRPHKMKVKKRKRADDDDDDYDYPDEEEIPIANLYSLVGRADVARKVHDEAGNLEDVDELTGSKNRYGGTGIKLMKMELSFPLLQLMTAGIDTTTEHIPRKGGGSKKIIKHEY